MKFFVFVSTLVLVATAPLAATAAPRPNGTMIHFFEALQGHWTGTGTVSQLVNVTERKTFRLDADVQVSHLSDFSWNVRSNFRADGSQTLNEADYEVRDNDLFVSNAGPLYPVRVLEMSPYSLSYRITGFVAEITYRYTLSGDTLRVNTIEESHGYPVREQNYMLRRF